MKIAIDVSPLQTGHKVRGVGFYLEHLKNSLIKYFPKNEYIFFERGEDIPEHLDLIHFPYFEPFFLALPIYKRYKTVVTVHDLTPIVFSNAFPKGIKGELKWQMQRFSLRKANIIITDSEASKKDILKYVGAKESRVKVIYLAAGEEFKKLEKGTWQVKLRKKYNLPEKFVLYVGDVTWNKNLPRLLDAVTELDMPIVMVGKNLVSEDYDKDNPWNNDLNRINELARSNDKITRVGFLPSEELIQIYNMATIFAMPSLYEGFGLPVLEAMACGCPVLTSKEGSLEEVAGDAAYYVDAYDVESIKFGLDRVYKDQDKRKELVEKGNENIKRFSWKKTAKETLDAYEEAIRK